MFASTTTVYTAAPVTVDGVEFVLITDADALYPVYEADVHGWTVTVKGGHPGANPWLSVVVDRAGYFRTGGGGVAPTMSEAARLALVAL